MKSATYLIAPCLVALGLMAPAAFSQTASIDQITKYTAPKIKIFDVTGKSLGSVDAGLLPVPAIIRKQIDNDDYGKLLEIKCTSKDSFQCLTPVIYIAEYQVITNLPKCETGYTLVALSEGEKNAGGTALSNDPKSKCQKKQ